MNNERKVDFAVISSDGTKPTSELHCVGFDEDGGLATHLSVRGHFGEQLVMACKLVERLAKKAAEDDINGAAAFICAVGHALHDGAGEEVMKRASTMLNVVSNPEKLIEALDELLDREGAED